MQISIFIKNVGLIRMVDTWVFSFIVFNEIITVIHPFKHLYARAQWQRIFNNLLSVWLLRPPGVLVALNGRGRRRGRGRKEGEEGGGEGIVKEEGGGEDLGEGGRVSGWGGCGEGEVKEEREDWKSVFLPFLFQRIFTYRLESSQKSAQLKVP